ncbi:hypothetical protein PN499_26350 [Kamptonema animale CS-326]|nr:hypothetical protein [Kamptonema animale CS-326]
MREYVGAGEVFSSKNCWLSESRNPVSVVGCVSRGYLIKCGRGAIALLDSAIFKEVGDRL